MKQLILFLIRRRLGLREFQQFRFVNQKSNTDVYFFTSTAINKKEGSVIRPSSVSLNWLLNDDCEIETLN